MHYHLQMPSLLPSFWAGEMFIKAVPEIPEFRNSDGESFLSSEVHFPVLGDMDAVPSILDKIPDLEGFSEDEETGESDVRWRNGMVPGCSWLPVMTTQ